MFQTNPFSLIVLFVGLSLLLPACGPPSCGAKDRRFRPCGSDALYDHADFLEFIPEREVFLRGLHHDELDDERGLFAGRQAVLDLALHLLVQGGRDGFRIAHMEIAGLVVALDAVGLSLRAGGSLVDVLVVGQRTDPLQVQAFRVGGLQQLALRGA